MTDETRVRRLHLRFRHPRGDRAGKALAISPKAFALLELLIESRPKAVSKADIHSRLWPDTLRLGSESRQPRRRAPRRAGRRGAQAPLHSDRRALRLRVHRQGLDRSRPRRGRGRDVRAASIAWSGAAARSRSTRATTSSAGIATRSSGSTTSRSRAATRASRSTRPARRSTTSGSKNGTYVGGKKIRGSASPDRSRRREDRSRDADPARPETHGFHAFDHEGAFSAVTLSAGTRLGPYEILGAIGAGGMGEVYRARDTKLSRDVAIKVLPPALAEDVERLARFEKEARTASALNHPNIVTIYEIGEADGASFIAMELVEGKTLRELIGGGTLAAEAAALRRGADGRRARQGARRRDRAPGPEARERDGDAGRVRQDPRLRPGEARAGAGFQGSRGTEPRHGDAGNRGGDGPGHGRVHVAGAGERGAGGLPVGSVLLRLDPLRDGDGPARVRASDAARRLSRRSSRRSRSRYRRRRRRPRRTSSGSSSGASRRIPRIGTARRRTWHGTSPRCATTPRGSRSAGVEPPAARRMRLSRAALAAAALAAAGIAVLTFLAGQRVQARRDREAPPPKRTTLTFRRGYLTGARFAPDGQTIVYSAAWDGKPSEIFTTRVGSTESRPLGISKAGILAVSSTGEMAVSLGCEAWKSRCRGTLARVPLAGGVPREVLDDVVSADWSPDGRELAVLRGVGSRLEYPIGKVVARDGGIPQLGARVASRRPGRVRRPSLSGQRPRSPLRGRSGRQEVESSPREWVRAASHPLEPDRRRSLLLALGLGRESGESTSRAACAARRGFSGWTTSRARDAFSTRA